MMGFLDASRLFADCWKLYKKYFGMDMTEDDWDKLVDMEMKRLWEKYQRKKFAKDLILAVADELGRIDRYKKARRKRDGQER